MGSKLILCDKLSLLMFSFPYCHVCSSDVLWRSAFGTLKVRRNIGIFYADGLAVISDWPFPHPSLC